MKAKDYFKGECMSKLKVGDEIVCEHRTEGVNNYLVPNTIYTENWLKLVARKSMKKSAEHIREEILSIDYLIEKSKNDIEEAEKKREALIEQLREKVAMRIAQTLSVEDVRVGEPLILTGNSLNDFIHTGSAVVVELNDKGEIPFKVRSLATGKTG